MTFSLAALLFTLSAATVAVCLYALSRNRTAELLAARLDSERKHQLELIARLLPLTSDLRAFSEEGTDAYLIACELNDYLGGDPYIAPEDSGSLPVEFTDEDLDEHTTIVTFGGVDRAD